MNDPFHFLSIFTLPSSKQCQPFLFKPNRWYESGYLADIYQHSPKQGRWSNKGKNKAKIENMESDYTKISTRILIATEPSTITIWYNVKPRMSIVLP